jgi:BNR/Asp-box repeat
VLAWGVARGSGDDAQARAVTTPAPTLTPALSQSPVPLGGLLIQHGPNVRMMGLVPQGFAWFLNDDGLFTTAFVRAGEKITVGYVDVTPPGVAVDHIRGVDFEDEAHGWAVVTGPTDASNATQLLAYRTTDGGETWQSSPMGEPDLFNTFSAPSGAASIDFIGRAMGWAVVRGVPGVQHDEGDLYRTEDGGETWSKLSAPSGDPIFFEDADRGWAGGRGFLTNPYSTRDGGATWSGGPLPSNWPYMLPFDQYVGPPVKADDGRLILAQTGTTNDASTLTLAESTDDGETWNTFATGSVRPEHGSLVPYILPSGGVIALSSDGAARLWQAPQSHTIEQSPVSDLGNVYSLDFLDSQNGWALVGQRSCTTATACEDFNLIEQTEDGGQTWTPLIMPGSIPTPFP